MLLAISVMPFRRGFQGPPRADSLNHRPIHCVNRLLSKLIDGKLDQVKEPDTQAEILSEFVAAALKRGEPAVARQWLQRLVQISDNPATRRPGVLIQRAKAERLVYNDERWRSTFLEAILTADRSSAYVRRDIGVPLLAALARILTGLPMLD